MKIKPGAKELLAKEILQEAVRLWREENKDRKAVEMPDGDFAISIDVELAEVSFGNFNGNFLPTVRFILQNCENYTNVFPVLLPDKKGRLERTTLGALPSPNGEREDLIKRIAITATHALLSHLESRFQTAVFEHLEDSLAMAQIELHDYIAATLHATVDFGSDINKYAKAAAIRRESGLCKFVEQPQLGNVQAIITHSGRPKKGDLTQKVADAFEHLGKQASQTSVADYAGVSVRTLNGWAKDSGYPHWKNVEEHYFKKFKIRQ
jgi:hypothetical protein